MNGYIAVIRNDYRVERESIQDLKMEVLRLVDLGLIKVVSPGKEILVVRGGEFIGWISVSWDTTTDSFDVYLERPTTDRENMLWQMLVDMID